MSRKFIAIAALALAFSIGAIAPAIAQQGKPASREETAAAVCMLAPMTAEKRLEACNYIIESGSVNGNALAVALIGKTNAYLEMKEDEKALAAATKAIAAAPNLPLPHVTRAAIYSQMDEHQKAIADASRGIELDRRNPGGYAIRAEAYIGQRNYAFALGDIDEALTMAPKFPQQHLLRSITLLGLDKDDEALSAARSALRLNLELASAHLVRFDIFMDRKQYALAAADANRAAELEPKFYEAQHAASTAYAHDGKFERSVEIMDDLIAKTPDSAQARNGRCWALALMPDPERALPDCQLAIKKDPEHFQALDSRAFVYWQTGRIEEARADLKAAKKIDPDFWDWDKREERFVTVLARRYLISLGHYTDPIDANFDDMTPTEDAVKAFQKQIGVRQTGKARLALVTRMGRELR